MKTTRLSLNATGHIGKDAIITQLPQKKAQVLSFLLFTNEFYKNKAGEHVDQKKSIQVSRWYPEGKNIQKFSEALKKGTLVSCVGKPTWRAYADKDGVPSVIPSMTVDEIDILKFASGVDEIASNEISEANNYPYTGDDEDLPF
jgi:single-stranded DNA-binding protein